MSDPGTPGPLPEEDFGKMVVGALGAHAIEPRLQAILEKAAGNSNGSGLIAMPGGQPVRINTPSAQHLCLEIIQALRISLQTQRIILVALNDMDTRFRQHQAASTASAGSTDPDSPGKPAPGNIGTGPAETQAGEDRRQETR